MQSVPTGLACLRQRSLPPPEPVLNRDVYKRRFAIERTFAWIDKFRTLLVRFERKDVYFLGFHYLAFALVNLRNLLPKV